MVNTLKSLDPTDTYSIFHPKMSERTRNEAQTVKDCFTKFSFQAIIFTAAIIGVLAKLELGVLAEIIPSTAVIILLLTVARIGTYKYASANRLYGFELYADKVRAQKLKVPDMGWEQAVLAWRVIQASLFAHFHITPREHMFRFYLLQAYKVKKQFKQLKRKRPKSKNKSSEQSSVIKLVPWFRPDHYARVLGVVYYAGGYLKTMLIILHLLVIIVLCFQWYFLIAQILTTESMLTLDLWVALGINVAVVFCVIFRISLSRTQLKLLEGGFLSIHTCGILWHVVTVAHARAISKLSENYSPYDYLEELSIQALAIKKEQVITDEIITFPDIYKWINKTSKVKEAST